MFGWNLFSCISLGNCVWLVSWLVVVWLELVLAGARCVDGPWLELVLAGAGHLLWNRFIVLEH